MRRGVLVIGLLAGLNGCATHCVLRNDTVRTTDTLMDLQYQQVLDNVARFHADPDTVPSFAIASAGTVSVNDQTGAGVSPTYSPTLTFATQAGGALPILSLLLPLSAQRAVTADDAAALEAIRQGRTRPPARFRVTDFPPFNPGLLLVPRR